MAPNYSQMTSKELERLELKKCPFNSSHIIRLTRYQKHVAICYQTINTFERNKWKSCPFNASHYSLAEDYDIHLSQCTDNKPYIRQIWEQLEDKPLIDFNVEIKIKEEKIEDEVKEEVKQFVEPLLKPNPVSNDWFDPNRKNFSIFQRPDATTAEDLINDESYWLENRGSVDPISFSALKKYERKRLRQLMCDKLKQNKSLAPIKKNFDPFFTYHGLSGIGADKDKAEDMLIFNRIPQINHQSLEMKTDPLPSTKRPLINVEEGQHSLHTDLHLINIPVDYQRLVVSEANHGIDSELVRALRSIDPFNGQNKVEVVTEKPFRLPKSCPFNRELRKPKIGVRPLADTSPKPDINNN